MRSEEMERWGVASIFKESAKLLHKHYRLFLPFFLAFYLPTSLASVFQIFFLPNSSTPPLYAKYPASNLQGSDLADVPLSTTVVYWTVRLLVYVLGTLGVGAVAYITAYVYTPTDGDDDRSIVLEVFKLLPLAFLRILVTHVWIVLAAFLLVIVSFISGIIFYIIVSYVAQLNDPTLLRFFTYPPFVAGIIVLTIMFAFSRFIAVLEPGNYGIEALKRSSKLVRIGGVWTIFVVSVLAIVLPVVSAFPTVAVVIAGKPLWEIVTLGVTLGFLDSVISVYLGVVFVVTYFVYKSRFDAGSTAIPLIKRPDSVDHDIVYNPLMDGSTSRAPIGEP